MAPNPKSLEYEEEDLFGSDEDATLQSTVLTSIASAKPVASISAASSSLASSSRQQRAAAKDAEKRLAELRGRKRGLADESKGVGRGVSTLKSYCLTVVRANSARVWDIGDMEYPLIRTFLDELPMDQLAAIESISPHIRKDTDWLWEIFVLQDYPLFHERCRDRKGEERTSGWRRMYKKAGEDAKERQSHAADRVAERYRQLDNEKAAKRIVFVDKIVTKGKKREGWGMKRGGGSGGMMAPRGGPLPAGRSSGEVALAKARMDSQRARVALTHASGRYVAPPSRPRARTNDNELFKNPYLGSSSTNQANQSRLPAPPSRPTQTPPSRPRISSPPTSPIPGSYPTAKAAQVRAALPAHLAKPSKPPTTQSVPARFRLPDTKPLKQIRKPTVQNFNPPKVICPEPIDFFGNGARQAPSGLLESLGRSRQEEQPKVSPVDDRLEGCKRKHIPEEDAVSVSSTRSAPATSFLRPTTSGGSLSADESSKLNSVLFRKKAKPRTGTGRVGA